MRSLVFVFALLVGISSSPPMANAAAAGCRFQLGFATLHALLPTEVGDCLEDEQHDPSNGDAVQHTTGGLLVWRRADNWTAFTDGYHTWVNGPGGVQERLNSERFAWEANPSGLPVVGAAVQAEPAISVRQPQPYDLVDDPFVVTGIGTGFEGMISVRVRDGTGKELARLGVHAGGTGILGNFQAALPLGGIPATAQGTVEVYEPSPKGDGSELHKVTVPITFGTALLSPYHGFALATVQPGDTLRSIAQHWYGSADQWARLFEANRHQLATPGALQPGQVLRVPQ